MRNLCATLFLGVLFSSVSTSSLAQKSGRVLSASAYHYAFRPITLPKGILRIDLAPPDYGYMEHGQLNHNRGLNMLIQEGDDVNLGFGAGASYGIERNFELGALLFPFIFAPDFDFGDMELFGRYGFVQGSAQLAAQLTLRIPTQTEFGLGIGMPMVFRVTKTFLLDTGLELEIIFYDDELVNLDLPAAFNFSISPAAFIGFRTGILVVDMDEAAINLGLQGGFSIDPTVGLTASFNWPAFLWTGGGDTFNPDTFEILFGLSLYIDTL